jgi:hypothetical protein
VRVNGWRKQWVKNHIDLSGRGFSKMPSRAAIQADAFAAGALKERRRRQCQMSAAGAHIPPAVTLRHHRLEIAILDAIRAANCLGLLKSSPVHHRFPLFVIQVNGEAQQAPPVIPTKLLDWRPIQQRVEGPCVPRDLEQVPEELVVHLVVELHFLRLHERPQRPRATVGRRLLQVGVPALHIFAE